MKFDTPDAFSNRSQIESGEDTIDVWSDAPQTDVAPEADFNPKSMMEVAKHDGESSGDEFQSLSPPPAKRTRRRGASCPPDMKGHSKRRPKPTVAPIESIPSTPVSAIELNQDDGQRRMSFGKLKRADSRSFACLREASSSTLHEAMSLSLPDQFQSQGGTILGLQGNSNMFTHFESEKALRDQFMSVEGSEAIPAESASTSQAIVSPNERMDVVKTEFCQVNEILMKCKEARAKTEEKAIALAKTIVDMDRMREQLNASDDDADVKMNEGCSGRRRMGPEFPDEPSDMKNIRQMVDKNLVLENAISFLRKGREIIDHMSEKVAKYENLSGKKQKTGEEDVNKAGASLATTKEEEPQQKIIKIKVKKRAAASHGYGTFHRQIDDDSLKRISLSSPDQWGELWHRRQAKKTGTDGRARFQDMVMGVEKSADRLEGEGKASQNEFATAKPDWMHEIEQELAKDVTSQGMKSGMDKI